MVVVAVGAGAAAFGAFAQSMGLAKAGGLASIPPAFGLASIGVAAAALVFTACKTDDDEG